MRTDDCIGALETAAEKCIDAENRRATGMGPVDQELLEVRDIDEPKLPGLGANDGGGSDAGLKDGNFAEAIPGADIIEVDLLSRGRGAHLISAAQHHVEIQVCFTFTNDDLAGRGRNDLSVGAKSFTRLVVHEGEDAGAGENKVGHEKESL